ncbi:TVP38/TMEM64 family protein [Fundidesulfovibrio terrae]|uniref:TVP38/TMEM64 family protein n=1 Tax=Fundidesulfovibrio terrae TaxID=2922866 RepID=UPI001FAF2BD8|nr:TVP38/TMEM64 family protein [Fundidesulfovibrio terrae]
MNRTVLKKVVLAGGVAGLAALFFWLDGPRYLDLQTLKASRAYLQDLYGQRPLAMLAGYFLLYVLMAAMNLPGAAALSLVGSAVFGFWAGLVTVSFASSMGATLACALSRFVLRDAVRSRFKPTLDRIDSGLAKEGVWYLVSLRLVPVFPFFLINLCMGLTTMPLKTFYWASQLGMLPGTAVFVNAGTELGRIESVKDVLSPGLLGAFALLAVFPLAAKWALKRFRR